MAQAAIYELTLGIGEELHIGKNLISLCNKEAFPFHYLFLEQHPAQTPARILFIASSPGSANTAAALQTGALLSMDMEKHVKGRTTPECLFIAQQD